MYFILFLGEEDHLREGQQGRSECVVGEEEVIEVDLSGLVLVDEVAVGAVDGVEGEACEVHGHEVEVHALDAGLGRGTSCGGSFSIFARRRRTTTRRSRSIRLSRLLAIASPTFFDRFII